MGAVDHYSFKFSWFSFNIQSQIMFDINVYNIQSQIIPNTQLSRSLLTTTISHAQEYTYFQLK